MTLAADLRLDEEDLEPTPFPLFGRWLADVEAMGLPEFNAMTLATATPDGRPSARVVLLRGYDETGFVFYTNYQSRKGAELADNPRAALVFFWQPLNRQIRIEGSVSRVSAAESDAYFASRPRGHRFGALVSPQSRPIPDRTYLERRMEELWREFEGRPDVPRPEYWGGFRVEPSAVEFWQGRENRLHDRIRYERTADGWRRQRLAP